MADDIARTVAKFFERYPKRTYEKGQIIVHAEEDPRGILYLVKGRINQYDIAPSGSEVVVNIFKPPAFFPMSWAINHTPNQYFFEAASSVVAHQAPAEEAVQFLRDHPEVTFDLLARVYRGLDGLLRRTTHLMGGDAGNRVLFELLNAAYRFGEPAPDGTVAVPLREHDLAKQSGLARETVNRVLQKLKTQGLVRITQDGYELPDIHAVEQLLGTSV